MFISAVLQVITVLYFQQIPYCYQLQEQLYRNGSQELRKPVTVHWKYIDQEIDVIQRVRRNTDEIKDGAIAEAEPESEGTLGQNAEPKTEEENVANPEVGSEEPNSEAGEGEANTEMEQKGKSEIEAEVGEGNEANSEAESEGVSSSPEEESKGEAEMETGAAAEERPKPYEIIIPPITLMIIIILGLLGLALWSKRNIYFKPRKELQKSSLQSSNFQGGKNKDKSNKSITKVAPVEKTFIVTVAPEKNDNFFTEFDVEVLGSLGSSNNRPLQLARVSLPALLSLGLCPFTLYLYGPLTSFFWPSEKFEKLPDINEAIACFLAPAGLVYATSFGFAFQSALTKQQAILEKITHELGLLDQIITLCSKISFPSLEQKMKIYKAVKSEAIFTALQIMNTTSDKFVHAPQEDVTIKIWDVLDTLRMIIKSGSATLDLDQILATKVVNHILELNSICSDRMGTLHASIHPLKWAFLESLGFFSFFGILLIQTQSYRSDLTMCIITVFSISLLCFVVADLDSPFCGFFRVDISALPEVVMRAKKTYEIAKLGQNVLVTYPDREK